MSTDERLPIGLAFADALNWLMMHGRRAHAGSRPGRPWSPKDLGDAIGRTDRQVRYWLKNEHLPSDTVDIEREIFGKDYMQHKEERLELRKSLYRSNLGYVPGEIKIDDKKTVSNFMYSISVYFIERRMYSEKIIDIINRKSIFPTKIVLFGLSGTGKSTIAANIIGRINHLYEVIWWFDASNDMQIKSQYFRLASRLGFVPSKQKDEKERILEIIYYLSQLAANIVLIFDNFQKQDVDSIYLPECPNIAVIVTSNYSVWDRGFYAIEISEFDNDTGAKFLKERSPESGSMQNARILSEALGDLPLALEQAGAFCEQTGASFSDYVYKLQQYPIDILSSTIGSDEKYRNGNTIMKSIGITMEELSKKSCTAIRILAYISYFDVNLFPKDFLDLVFIKQKDLYLESRTGYQISIDSELHYLRAFSLIKFINKNEISKIQYVATHRLTRLITGMNIFDIEHYTQSSIDSLFTLYPIKTFDEPETWEKCAHFDNIVDKILLSNIRNEIQDDLSLKKASICDSAGGYLQSSTANYGRALAYFLKSLQIRREILNPNSSIVGESHNNLANIYFLTDSLDQAENHYKIAIEIARDSRNGNRIQLATRLSNYGFVFLKRGFYKNSLSLNLEALSIRNKDIPEHGDTAQSLNNIAFLYYRMGRFKRSAIIYNIALGLYHRSVSDDHPNINRCRRNIALALKNLGMYDFALFNAQIALKWHLEKLGEEHPWTVDSKMLMDDIAKIE